MSATSSAIAIPTPLRWVRGGVFAGFGPRHVALATIVAATINLVGWAAFLEQIPGAKWLPKLIVQMQWLLVGCVIGVTTILCAIAADNLLGGRWPRIARYALALLAATALGSLLANLVEPFITGADAVLVARRLQMLGVSHARILALQVAHVVLLAYVLLVLHAVLETSRKAAGELHAARLAALQARHELVEEDLLALQSRIDPERLVATLGEIEAAYARDLMDGERRLDELISRLRAALPA